MADTKNADLLGVLAAHRISERAIATWSPSLARAPRVLVPIRVDALVVRRDGMTFADCKMKPPPPATTPPSPPVPASKLLPDPFQDETAARSRGVYLHWALPDALTRGVGSTTGDARFPSVPDRWLVVRMSPSTATRKRAVTGWVLESNRQTPRKVDLSAFVESGNGDQDDALTALGQGDPAWSGYFANCENRLAFFDDLAGVERGPLAYLVCGWYADAADDPLREGTDTFTELSARLKALGWELPAEQLAHASTAATDAVVAATSLGLATKEATFAASAEVAARGPAGKTRLTRDEVSRFQPDVMAKTAVDLGGKPAAGAFRLPDVWWPRQTLCHGGVVGIGWPEQGIPIAPEGLLGEVGGAPSAAGISVAIGATMAEAFGAIIAKTTGAEDEARLVEAVLLGATDELDHTDGPARIDSRLHADGFGSLPGGETEGTIQQRPVGAPPRHHVADPTAVAPGKFPPPSKSTRPGASIETKGVDTKVIATKGSSSPLDKQPQMMAKAGLLDVLAEVKAAIATDAVMPIGPPNVDPNAPSEPVRVKRSLPRLFVPHDPVVLIQGARRSFKHQRDGIHTERSTLICRASGHTVRDIAPPKAMELLGRATITGDDLIEHGIGNGSVPSECEDLLRELALLDPGAVESALHTAPAGVKRDAAMRELAVEQIAWWMSRDPKRDLALLEAKSAIAGILPSPVAVSPPSNPWVPLHLDWEIEYVPSPRGARDWSLGEVDFAPRPESIPPASATGKVITGRALLTAGAADVAADAVRRAIERAQGSGGSVALTPNVITRFHSSAAMAQVTKLNALQIAHATDPLNHLADDLAALDVLSGALDPFHTKLRGGLAGDGVTVPDAGATIPADMAALRAGFVRIRRLRLVDCFGQTVELVDPERPAEIVASEPFASTPPWIELAPRFTSPSRLWLRYLSADDDATIADDAISPVCGFVLPNHLDGSLEAHAADGASLGAVRPQRGAGIVWEDAPGRPTTVGQSPTSAIANGHLAGIAQALVDWGVADSTPGAPSGETALSALLRIVDATLWSIDPFGHVGEEHLSLLVGHPIAVLRANLRFEVQELAAPDRIRGELVPVRLGALAHWQDGLLGYFVDDDYRTLHIPDAACARLARPIGPHQGFLQQAADTGDYFARFAEDIGVSADGASTPVDHPFVDSSGVSWILPNRDVKLTLLVEPHSLVHVTSGLLPRKEIGMRREWVTPGLKKLAPTFRFGPVLVDPKRIRMPVAADIRGTWSWRHRIDVATWAQDEVVSSATDAQLPPDPSEAQEGWLQLTPEEAERG